MSVEKAASAICILAIFFGMGMYVGSDLARSQMQREAIKHGYAAHDPQTGKWGWKP